MPRKKVHPEAAEDCLKALGVKTWLEAFVVMGFGDVFDLPVRSLDFRTEETRPQDLALAIRMIPGYNNFDGANVAQAVMALHERGMLMDASFGREGSPVLYLTVPYWTHQRSNAERFSAQGERIPDETQRAYLDAINEIMRGLKADEISESEPSGNTVRAWWD